MSQNVRDSFEEFSITIDGSPIGNDTEAVSLRLVNKKMRAVSGDLISLKTCGKKLDGQATSNNVTSELRDYRF